MAAPHNRRTSAADRRGQLDSSLGRCRHRTAVALRVRLGAQCKRGPGGPKTTGASEDSDERSARVRCTRPVSRSRCPTPCCSVLTCAVKAVRVSARSAEPGAGKCS
ncbi:hypothetical protein BMF94_6308, partial [Rhodotorula taiwanensis]